VVTSLPFTVAVFLDEAYKSDFHHALLGLPQQHTTFFHRPQADSKASLLYTLSDKAILGAVNPKTGAIVWRQSLASASVAAPGFLRAGEDEDVVISAVGQQVRAWDALSGRLAWGNEFGDGVVADLEVIETAVATEAKRRKDALALFGSKGQGIVRRLHGDTGEVVWEFHDKRCVMWSVSGVLDDPVD
jgi:outer membrane protein assembly factor BamB